MEEEISINLSQINIFMRDKQGNWDKTIEIMSSISMSPIKLFKRDIKVNWGQDN